MKTALGEGRGEGRGKDWQNGYCLVLALATGDFDLLDCSPPGSSVHGIFFRQDYWSGLPVPSSGDLPDPGIEPISPASPELQTDSLPAEPSGELTLLLL